MCQGNPSIAVCSCGASFAACDTVEALCHITQNSANCHSWVYIDTGVWTAGRLIAPPAENPANFKEYLSLKGRLARAVKTALVVAIFLSSTLAAGGSHARTHPYTVQTSKPFGGIRRLVDCCSSISFLYLDGIVFSFPKKERPVIYIWMPNQTPLPRN